MKIETFEVPIIGFVGQSGSGKTTLLQRLIPCLIEDGLKVGCVKHTHHDFEIDKTGKDSYKLREAGASQMLLGSPNHLALMARNDSQSNYSLQDFCMYLDQAQLDLILVEGFGDEDIPKIEIRRTTNSKVKKSRDYEKVIAVIDDGPFVKGNEIECFGSTKIDALKEFLLDYIGWKRPETRNSY